MILAVDAFMVLTPLVDHAAIEDSDYTQPYKKSSVLDIENSRRRFSSDDGIALWSVLVLLLAIAIG